MSVPDPDKLEQPITRAEAYVLLSMLKRITTALSVVTIEMIANNRRAALDQLVKVRRIDAEMEPILQDLVMTADEAGGE